MNAIISELDENLIYISHELIDGIYYITACSKRKEAFCPYCGYASVRVHSRYKRRFQDLPISGHKVIIILKNQKYLCENPACKHKTFAESFEFFTHKARRTKRLDDKILQISLNCSSIAATKYLKNNVAKVGKSTICNLLKKRNAY